MKIPPLFKELSAKRKELNKEFKFMGFVAINDNYAIDNDYVVKGVEKILYEMLNVIEKIKQSYYSQEHLPEGSLEDLVDQRLHARRNRDTHELRTGNAKQK